MINELGKILPSAYNIVCCLRFAVLIIGVLIWTANVFYVFLCPITWIVRVIWICLIANTIYIWLFWKISKLEAQSGVATQFMVYLLLLVSSISPNIFTLCGGDYLLYDIFGEYILLEYDKIVLPIAFIMFVTVTYWLPVCIITNIREKYHRYLNIKKDFYNG